jgi:uncharacterized membrane protein
MMKKLLRYISAAAIITLGNISLVLAQAPPIIPSGNSLVIPSATLVSSEKNTFVADKLLPTITRTVITLSASLSVLFIIIGGITILTAYGKTEKIESAKKTITWAIIGLLISILSYAIVSIISGIELPK